jgi:tRNA threonylcarbamoyladenosine biosynthesis protein TsaB
VSYILNIETATTVCSVSVSKNDELLFCRELDEGFTHAENLHLFINESLHKTGIEPSQLSAVAVSKGPGSYTGLRIGVSTAKGLAYALNIPLIAVDTLQIMAVQAFKEKKDQAAIYCPMIDARRMEVYTNLYDHTGKPLQQVESLIIDEQSILKYQGYPQVYFFGDGMEKCRSLLTGLGNSHFLENIRPSAKTMPVVVYSRFMASQFENVAYFEPFYLKDFMPGKKKSSL